MLEHRRRLRKPLTTHAARVLAGKLAQHPDPNFAADEMIANGWSGFESEWLANRRSRQHGTGPPSKTFHDIARDGLGDQHDNECEYPGPTINLSAATGR